MTSRPRDTSPPLRVVRAPHALEEQLLPLLRRRFGTAFDDHELEAQAAESVEEAGGTWDAEAGASPLGHAYRHACWRLSNQLRARSRHVALRAPGDDDGAPEPLSGAENLHEQAQAREALARVFEVIAALPRRLRECFLRHLDGESPDDIADALGIERASVPVNVSRARARIREAVPEYAPDPPPSGPKRGRPPTSTRGR